MTCYVPKVPPPPRLKYGVRFSPLDMNDTRHHEAEFPSKYSQVNPLRLSIGDQCFVEGKEVYNSFNELHSRSGVVLVVEGNDQE